MLYFFYFARNILGLIMVISPVAGLLFIDFNPDLFVILSLASVLGIPVGLILLKILPFRLLNILSASVFLVSAFRLTLTGAAGESWASLACMGLCFPMLAAILPVNIVSGWFRSSKVRILGMVWSISLVSAVILGIIMKRFTYTAFIISVAMMIAGTGFLLQTPPHLPVRFTAAAPDSFHNAHQQKSSLKLFIFFLCISFTTGLAFMMHEAADIDFFLSEKALFIAGLCAGPAAAALLGIFRGIYSSCIWLLFLAEITMFCSGQAAGAVLAGYSVALSSGLCLGGLPVALPVMAYYVCGPVNYNDSFCRILTSIPAGLLLSAMVKMLVVNKTFLPWISAGAMILLIFAFFTIFSAWKRRLFLLKNTGI